MIVTYNQGKIRFELDNGKLLNLVPGDDLFDLHPDLQKIADDYWTQDVVASYQTLITQERLGFSNHYNDNKPLTVDERYKNAVTKEPIAVALTLAINDGSLIPAASVAVPVLAQIIKAKM